MKGRESLIFLPLKTPRLPPLAATFAPCTYRGRYRCDPSPPILPHPHPLCVQDKERLAASKGGGDDDEDAMMGGGEDDEHEGGKANKVRMEQGTERRGAVRLYPGSGACVYCPHGDMSSAPPRLRPCTALPALGGMKTKGPQYAGGLVL